MFGIFDWFGPGETDPADNEAGLPALTGNEPKPEDDAGLPALTGNETTPDDDAGLLGWFFNS